MSAHFLDRLFSPNAIAVFGASEKPDSVGGRVYDNLRHSGYSGPVYPLNPKYKSLYRKRCDRSGVPRNLSLCTQYCRDHA